VDARAEHENVSVVSFAKASDSPLSDMPKVVAYLRSLHAQLAEELIGVSRNDHETLCRIIGMQSALDLAWQRLELCESWNILPKSIVHVLPPQRIGDGSSNYRIMEDCETESRERWVEADFQGRTIRFNEGNLLIQL
jgi:hypothetical protein